MAGIPTLLETLFEALTVVGVHRLNLLFCLILSEYHCLKVGSDREDMRHYHPARATGPRSGLGGASCSYVRFQASCPTASSSSRWPPPPWQWLRLYRGREPISLRHSLHLYTQVEEPGPPKPLRSAIRKCTKTQSNRIQWWVLQKLPQISNQMTLDICKLLNKYIYTYNITVSC